MRPTRDTWINPALALAVCAAGGALFSWLKTPLPWLIGPMLAMAALYFGGARLRVPRTARETGQVINGTVLGLYFTRPWRAKSLRTGNCCLPPRPLRS